jgi:hypothetical protein
VFEYSFVYMNRNAKGVSFYIIKKGLCQNNHLRDYQLMIIQTEILIKLDCLLKTRNAHQNILFQDSKYILLDAVGIQVK